MNQRNLQFESASEQIGLQYEENKELITHEKIPRTPFMVIGREKQYFLAWDMYQLTPYMQSKEEAIAYLETNLWDIVGIYIVSLLDKKEKMDKLEAQKQEQENTGKTS